MSSVLKLKNKVKITCIYIKDKLNDNYCLNEKGAFLGICLFRSSTRNVKFAYKTIKRKNIK